MSTSERIATVATAAAAIGALAGCATFWPQARGLPGCCFAPAWQGGHASPGTSLGRWVSAVPRQRWRQRRQRIPARGWAPQQPDEDSTRTLLHRHFVRDWDSFLCQIAGGEPACAAVLCGVAHAGNLGAIMRGCALLGVPLVVALGGLTRQATDRALWSSQLRRRRGWDVSLSIAPADLSVASALGQLRAAGLPLLGVSAHREGGARPLWEARLTAERLALVFGREKDGIPEEAFELLDGTTTVPMNVPGSEGSLNLSHAVSLVAYERRRQLLRLDETGGLRSQHSSGRLSRVHRCLLRFAPKRMQRWQQQHMS